MSRINVGRTFADKDHPGRWYVVLVVDEVWALVWWEDGKPHAVPFDQRKELGIRLDSFDFSMKQLLTRWGVTAKVVDKFLEERMYRYDPDVKNVRETRRPLTGRTLEVIRPRHPLPRVGPE